jgi:type IV pilus assembly protein PilV
MPVTTIRQRRQAGFTLIEVMVSVVILGIGLVGVVGCLTAALTTQQKASQIRLATAIAQDTIEDMRSRGFGTITYDDFPATSAVDDLHGGTQTIAITDNYRNDSRLKHVTVTISWRAPGGRTARVSLETAISNRTQHVGT